MCIRDRDISGSLKVSNNVSIGTDTLDTSYALDISGRLNCMELLIDGSEPLFGSQNIKVYDTTDISINNTYETVVNNISWSVGSSSVSYTNGNVGIGRGNPDTNYVLDISGDTRILGDLNITNDIHFGNRMDVIGDVSLNKNVSISGELIVFGDISGSGKNLYSIPNEALDNSMIRINGNDVSLGGELNFRTSQWVDNSFGDISNIYYTDGNVGIGISGPDVSYALDISGSLKVSNNVSIGTDTLDTSLSLIHI